MVNELASRRAGCRARLRCGGNLGKKDVGGGWWRFAGGGQGAKPPAMMACCCVPSRRSLTCKWKRQKNNKGLVRCTAEELEDQKQRKMCCPEPCVEQVLQNFIFLRDGKSFLLKRADNPNRKIQKKREESSVNYGNGRAGGGPTAAGKVARPALDEGGFGE